MILAGDVGGTKVRLVLCNEEGKNCREERFLSSDFKDFTTLLKTFIGANTPIACACLGIAGPVIHRQCKATNLPWEVIADDLERECTIKRVHLINDLEANAWGIRELRAEEFLILNEGKAVAGNQTLISAGTGLGEAGLYWDGKLHHPFACEGGHCDFGPTSLEEVDLLIYLREKYGHVSYERLLSGHGLHDLYRFLIDTKREEEEAGTALLMQTQDPPKVITEQATKGVCSASVRACYLFVSLYGSECANAALKFLAVGGVFIGGGIAPRLPSFFKKGGFMKAFLNKGRFASLLSHIPIKILLNDKAALLGAFRYAMERE